MNETEKDTSNTYGNYQHTTASKINKWKWNAKKKSWKKFIVLGNWLLSSGSWFYPEINLV